MVHVKAMADIRRLTIHDGPGTRDTVFLKGCPLHCLWCHNPECISLRPQLLFHQRLCVQCGACAKACSQSVHQFVDGKHVVDFGHCQVCGRCSKVCLTGALAEYGVPVTPDEIACEVLKEKEFYQQSGGGVTLSGGEPLLHPGFVCEVFQALRKAGVHTALDTCGHVPYHAFQLVLPFTDLILYDIKGMNPERHRRNTGQDNALILDNLSRLGKGPVPIEIRMPIIPGHNDFPEEIQAAGQFLSTLPAVCAIRPLPYHSLAHDKYTMCGMEDRLPDCEPPTPANLADIAERLNILSGKPVLLY